MNNLKQNKRNNMNHRISIHNASLKRLPIKQAQIKSWVQHVLKNHSQPAELALRFSTIDEMHATNKQYRNQDKPTNVLAFETKLPDSLSMKYQLLGDLMICPDVLLTESIAQNKPLEAHWAHIIIHGVLHLLGYDHIKKTDEVRMQMEEIKILHDLGFDNPYH